MLDVACGFPPMSTLDSATALAGWEIVGVDRVLPHSLVHDGVGNYAVFDDAGRATYFQPLVPTGESWAVLLADWEAPSSRFEALPQFAALLSEGGLLVCGTDWAGTVECRSFTYRKRGATLVPHEFAFSVDNVTPFGVVTYYALQDDDTEVETLSRLWELSIEISDRMGAELSAEAAAILGRHGYRARVNEVGHVAIALS